MDKKERVSVVLEQFIISKTCEMQHRSTTPEEITTPAEFVKAVNQIIKTVRPHVLFEIVNELRKVIEQL